VHSEQVVSLATDVAKLLGLSPSEQDTVRHGALLHDVGKLAIPNEILHKPGPLNDAEWRVMAEHPVIGKADPAPHAAARAPGAGGAPRARALGRQWLPRRPGRHGDPDRLADHPACDAYNAMITTRPYREAMSAEDAVAELRDKSGTQFDPQVVAALLKRLRVPALSPSASAASAASAS
jgi:HD-GYP domain-containing protein (c-di-GMP phosphodiesterase class II)